LNGSLNGIAVKRFVIPIYLQKKTLGSQLAIERLFTCFIKTGRAV